MIAFIADLIDKCLGHTPASVEDGRGRFFPLYCSSERWRDHQERADFPAEEFKRIRDKLVMRDLSSALTHSPHAVWLFVVVALFLIAFDLVFERDPIHTPIRLLAALLLIFFAVTLRHRMPRFRPDLLTEAMLAEQRCPSCARSLADLPAESDGCTICPECGGAWRIPGRRPIGSETR
ncbi:MAG: hypothetical protein EA376_07505 [Phycisphaeraceae bacterium]|nr:MAG: hypothetical protein EA376_07505 [Phycisphaeraceae bacterium]